MMEKANQSPTPKSGTIYIMSNLWSFESLCLGLGFARIHRAGSFYL